MCTAHRHPLARERSTIDHIAVQRQCTQIQWCCSRHSLVLVVTFSGLMSDAHFLKIQMHALVLISIQSFLWSLNHVCFPLARIHQNVSKKMECLHNIDSFQCLLPSARFWVSFSYMLIYVKSIKTKTKGERKWRFNLKYLFNIQSNQL